MICFMTKISFKFFKIDLSLEDTDKLVVSDKFKHSDNGSKYFIGYLDDDDIH